jgi:hypothetical protein
MSARGIRFADADRADVRLGSRLHPRHRDAAVYDPRAVADNRRGGHRLVVNLRRLDAWEGIVVQVAVREMADRNKRIGPGAKPESEAAIDVLTVVRQPDSRVEPGCRR